jgi:hypothetical protein
MTEVCTKLAIVSPKIFGPSITKLKGIKALHHLLLPICLERFNGLPMVGGHEHHCIQAIKYCTPHFHILDFPHKSYALSFQHTPSSKENWYMVLAPHNLGIHIKLT